MTFQFQLKTVYLSKFWNQSFSFGTSYSNKLFNLSLVKCCFCYQVFKPVYAYLNWCLCQIFLHLRRHKVLTQNKDLTCVCAQFRTHPSAGGREDMVLHSWGKILRDKTAVTRCLYNFTKQKASFNSLTQLNLNLQNPNDTTVVDHVLKNWLALT